MTTRFNRMSFRQAALGIGLAAIVASMSAIAATWSTDPRAVVNAASLADLKQARALAKSGKWERSAELIARHSTGPNPKAKLEYAILLSRGWGVARDPEAARLLLLQAVSYRFDGRGRTAFELGRLYKLAEGADCARIAFEWFSKAVRWHYGKAHLELASAYRKGYGVPADFDRALKHYRHAAAGGSASAVWSMIDMAERGTVDRAPDLASARTLAIEYRPMLEAEALAGNAYAARTIARLYLKGTVLEQDLAKADRWFREAAALGDPAAMHDLALMRLLADPPTEDGTAILDLFRESARRGYAGAMTALGRLHLESRFGLAPDEAVLWFQRGADAGHAGSMAELAKLLRSGDLVEPDLTRARELALKGAELGHLGSRRLLEEIDNTNAAIAGSAAPQTRNREGG